MIGKCEACGTIGSLDRAHIKTKGSGGDLSDDNILHLCRNCHSNQHRFGWNRMIEKYSLLKNTLDKKGWEIEDVFGVKKLKRK